MFVKILLEIYDEFRKLNQECEPEDIAHFMKDSSKKFLVDNQDLISEIFKLGCNKSFTSFISVFIWKNHAIRKK